MKVYTVHRLEWWWYDSDVKCGQVRLFRHKRYLHRDVHRDIRGRFPGFRGLLSQREISDRRRDNVFETDGHATAWVYLSDHVGMLCLVAADCESR